MSRLSDKNKNLTAVPSPQSPDAAGFIAQTSDETVPNGWLECNGQAVSRTEYAELFALIGTTYGAGDGSTTFNLPGGDLLNNASVEGTLSTTDNISVTHATESAKLTLQSTDTADSPRIDLIRGAGAFGDNSTDWGIQSGSGRLDFITNGSGGTTLALNFDGKVGVGTTSPVSRLEVREASASAARLTVSNTEGQAVIETDGARAFFGNAIANTALTIQAGNIGINQTSPSQQLHITATGVANSLLQSTGSGGSDEAILSIQSNSGTAILTRNSSGKTNLGGASSFNVRNSSGGVYLPVGGTSWVGLSDMRYKTKVSDFTNSLEKLQGLSAFTYTLNEDPEGEKSVHLGMSAQEVYEKIPEVVSGTPETKMGISYGRLVPVLVQAVQELKEENDNLKTRIEALENV